MEEGEEGMNGIYTMRTPNRDSQERMAEEEEATMTVTADGGTAGINGREVVVVMVRVEPASGRRGSIIHDEDRTMRRRLEMDKRRTRGGVRGRRPKRCGLPRDPTKRRRRAKRVRLQRVGRVGVEEEEEEGDRRRSNG